MLSASRTLLRVVPAPGLDPPPDPAALPEPGSPQRWPFLQRLRASDPLPLEPWLAALEAGRLAPLPDLLASLAPRLDAPAERRLLRWCLASPDADPALPALVLQRRQAPVAALLREALINGVSAAWQAALLPLLGHQRDPADFPLLAGLALEAHPTPVRRAALEGLCRGLSAWPLPALRQCLDSLAADLDPSLAAAALDALARLPEARRSLLPLRQRALAPAVAERLERRLRSLPVAPLLLVVHGRSGGLVPPELVSLAEELQRRRGAPVALRALTDPDPAPPPQGEAPLGVVPLLLLPGGHVRADLPPLLASLRRHGPLRRWPFLGAWPLWQQALAGEVVALAAAAGERAPGRPRLLHHPLEGALSLRYLRHLARCCDAICQSAPYRSADPEELALATCGPVLPLALASNRLTEALTPQLGAAAAAPLLARPALRQTLLLALEALP